MEAKELVSSGLDYGNGYRTHDMDTGCYIDGHWGQYGIARMVEIAEGLGYNDAEIIDLAYRHLAECAHPDESHIDDDGIETLVEAADEVEAWLNDNIAEAGYWFGWHDGEFFYQPAGWWAED